MQDFLINRTKISSSGSKTREITLIVFLITASFSILITISEEASAYTLHDPILIDGDGNFIAFNGVVDGSGTALDPYIIEGWEIDSLTTHGIHVKNTKAYFIIRNVYVHAFTININADNGIILYNVTNARVEDSILMESATGIALFYVTNTTVVNNELISNNFYGTRIMDSSNLTVISNNISSNNYDGIELLYSYDINITANNTTSNTDDGIYPWYSSFITILANNISHNDEGIFIRESENISVVDNYLSGNERAVDVFYSNNNNISNNNITQNYDGILIRYSEKNDIVDNFILSNTRYGVSSMQSVFVSITSNRFNSDGVSIFGESVPQFNSHIITTDNLINDKPIFYYKDQNDIDINNIPIGELIAVNCTNIKAINLTILDTDMGIQLAYVDDVLLADNDIRLNDITSLDIYRSTNLGILNNTLSSNEYSGAFFKYAENVTIMDNIISNSDLGISFIYSRNISFSTCNISLNNDNGIYIISSTNITLSSISIFSNSGAGIYLGDAIGVIIKNNTISSNKYGIEPDSCSNITIVNNNISQNFRGVYLSWPGSERILIERNNISNNNISLYLWFCANITISANDIISSTIFGISLSSCTNIHVYYNNFINNTSQAIDDNGNENQWDCGYPQGGNYWSDYTGIDLNSTPNQNVPPPDGIGDTPYVLDADSQDNFPLMEPYNSKTFENYTILKQGWNLISIPLIQENQSLPKALEMIVGYYDAVQYYNVNEAFNPWEHHKLSKPFGNDLSHLNETMGFWIHITKPGDTIFLYNGAQPSVNQSITIHQGWNMVGYPSLVNRTRDIALNNIIFDQDVDAIWAFNATTQTWKEIGPTDYFELGRGYWIHSKATKTWDVPL